jgi:radical SAM protein with 4Fe4S-binding SPASM domain
MTINYMIYPINFYIFLNYLEPMVKDLKKVSNLLLSTYYFLKSILTEVAQVKGMPVSVSVELTNNCNLKCPQCLSGSGAMTRNRGFMKFELFDKIVGELEPWLFNTNLYFQGESMLHPDFFIFLQRVQNTHTTISTNGHYLTDENAEKLVKSTLNKLIISLDGLDQETYSIYRKEGNFNKVFDGIKRVSEAKKRFRSKIQIEVQVLVNSFNEIQTPEFKKFAKELNILLKMKSMYISDPKEIDHWLPRQSMLSRYKMKNGEYVIKNSMPDRCLRLWFNPVITWDGKVVPCCFDKNAEHILGDLTRNSFREIWNGPEYTLFRKNLFLNRQKIDICRNCTSGLKGVKH